jgi:nitrate/nitrite transport system ATP-binding protein
LNDSEEYKKTRNALIEYLMDIGSERSSNTQNLYKLPDLQPKDLRWDF